MRTDPGVALAYQRAKTQFGPLARTVCDKDCQESAYCEAREDTHLGFKECMGEPVKSYVQDPLGTLAETLLDPWYEKTGWLASGGQKFTANEFIQL